MSEVAPAEPIRVGHVEGRELLADLYRPQEPNGAGVLLIHGGSFVHGDRRQLAGYGIALAQEGFTCMACEYRLATEAKWPAQLDDVQTALGYFCDHASSFDVATEKIAVSGNSAGGCLALLAAGLGVHPVAAAVALYPPVDFTGPDAKAQGIPEAMKYLLGEDVSDSRLRAMSPMTYVSPRFPATLLMTGNHDHRIHWSQSLKMYQALIEAGVQAEVHIFEGLPHAFDLIPAFGLLSARLITLFLDRHVVNPWSFPQPEENLVPGAASA